MFKNRIRLWDSIDADSGNFRELYVSRAGKAVPFLLHQENTIINVYLLLLWGEKKPVRIAVIELSSSSFLTIHRSITKDSPLKHFVYLHFTGSYSDVQLPPSLVALREFQLYIILIVLD